MKTIPEIQSQTIRSILVSRLRFMGDVVLSLPAVHALRKAFPDSQIVYLAEAPYHALLENHPDIDAVLMLDTKSGRLPWNLFSKLRHFRFDLAVDLFGNPRSALLTWLSGAGIRIGGDFRGRKFAYTCRIRDDRSPKNAIRFHLGYLKPLGIRADVSEPRLFMTKDEREDASGFLVRKGLDPEGLLIGMHPGASWPAKRWLPKRFGLLADDLVERRNAQVLFTEGPGETGLVDRIIAGCSRRMARTGVLPLRMLTAVLSHCDLFVSNDCGPMHLAPAVGTRTVGLFGPGEPEIWFPYDPRKGHRFVHPDISCSRCRRDFCDSMECMKAITVEEVYNAVSSSLNPR